MKTKVNVIVPYLTGHGGMETVLAEVTNFYNNNSEIEWEIYFSQNIGDKVFLRSFKNTHQILNNPKEVTQSSFKKIVNVFKLISFLIRSDADELLCMGTRMIKVAAVIRTFFHKKYKILSWIHFSLEGGDVVNVATLKNADYHLAISTGIKRQLIGMGIDSDRIEVIYNPINISTSIQKEPLINEPTTFLYLGRLQWEGQKNLQELFKSLISLTGSWQLLVIGSGNPHDEKMMKQFVQRYGITKNVKFLGWINDPWSRVECISASLLTSKFEGLPMGIIESLNHGIPCVSSDCPTGPDDLIKEHENGFLYTMGNTQQLSGILQGLINKEYQFNSVQVKNSIEWLSTEHFYKKLSTELLKINNF